MNIITPENIAFQYRLAGPFRRIWAYLDRLFHSIGQFVLDRLDRRRFSYSFMHGQPAVEPALVFALLFSFVMEWFYGGLFEALLERAADAGQTSDAHSCAERRRATDPGLAGGPPQLCVSAIDRRSAIGRNLPLGLYQQGLWSCRHK